MNFQATKIKDVLRFEIFACSFQMMRGANHEVHITQAAQFNDVVNRICDRVDDQIHNR